MKKRILSILVISVILLLCLGLTACNNASPQGLLANILAEHNHETISYKAVNTMDNSEGTLSVKLDAVKAGGSVAEFGARELSNLKQGIVISTTLVFGTATYKSGCFYELVSGMQYMVPKYSYSTRLENGNTVFSMNGEYDGGEFKFDKDVNGEKSNGSLSVSGTVFDNNQFQQALRSVTTFSSGFTIGFTNPVVAPTEETTANLTASGSAATENIKTPFTEGIEKYAESGISCYPVKIARVTEVEGSAQMLYYATENVLINGWEVKNPLVKIVEPFKGSDGKQYNMEYSLTAIEIA